MRHEIADQRLARRCGERAADAEPDRAGHHERDGCLARPGRGREGACQDDRADLRDEQQVLAVEAVGGAPAPRCEQEDGDEVCELQHSEQERGMRALEDVQGGGEILEPCAARRCCISDEIRPEVPMADQPQRGGRACRR